MNTKWVFSACVCCLTAIACNSANFIRNGDIKPPEGFRITRISEIKVLSGLPTNKNYLDLGIAAVSMLGGGLVSDNYPDAVEAAKKVASDNGGNAIVITNEGEAGVQTGLGHSQQRVRVNARVLYIFE